MAQDFRASDSASNGAAAPTSVRPASANGTAPSATRGKSIEERMKVLERSNAQQGRELKSEREARQRAETSLKTFQDDNQRRLDEWMEQASPEEVGAYIKNQRKARQTSPPDEDTVTRIRREASDAAKAEMAAHFDTVLRKRVPADVYEGFLEKAQADPNVTVDDLFEDWQTSQNPSRRRVAATAGVASETEVPTASEDETGLPESPVTAETLQNLKGTGDRGSQAFQEILRKDPAILDKPW